jgi:hypothetical protein
MSGVLNISHDVTLAREAIYDCPAARFHRAHDTCPVCASVEEARIAINRVAMRYQHLYDISVAAREYLEDPQPGSKDRLRLAFAKLDSLVGNLKGERI